MKKKLYNNPFFYFVAVSCMGYFVTILRLLKSHGVIFEEIFGVAGYFSLSDMIMHLVFVNQPAKVYFVSEQACFPPLAYVFYYFINRVLPGGETVDMTFYRSQPTFTLLYVLIAMLICCIFSEQLRTILNGCKESIVLAVLVICSEPFWGSAIERGNSVIIVLVLMIGALILKDSDSKVKREIALILIAVSAGLKIYPAIFGVLYLMEKRYKEAIRLVLYGVLFFFTPFLFFGGMAGFLQFLKNLTTVNRYEGNLYTIQGFVYLVFMKVTAQTEIPTAIRTVANVFVGLYGVIALVMSVKSKKYWQKLLLLSSLMIIFVPSSYPYTTVYLVIPFVYFWKEITEERMNCWYAVLFGMTFSIMAIPSQLFIKLFDLSVAYGIRYIALAAMIICVIVENVYQFERRGGRVTEKGLPAET